MNLWIKCTDIYTLWNKISNWTNFGICCCCCCSFCWIQCCIALLFSYLSRWPFLIEVDAGVTLWISTLSIWWSVWILSTACKLDQVVFTITLFPNATVSGRCTSEKAKSSAYGVAIRAGEFAPIVTCPFGAWFWCLRQMISALSLFAKWLSCGS